MGVAGRLPFSVVFSVAFHAVPFTRGMGGWQPLSGAQSQAMPHAKCRQRAVSLLLNSDKIVNGQNTILNHQGRQEHHVGGCKSNPGFLGDLAGSHADPLWTSRADGNAGALGGNRPRASEAQTTTCSSDQRNSIAKSQVHSRVSGAAISTTCTCHLELFEARPPLAHRHAHQR